MVLKNITQNSFQQGFGDSRCWQCYLLKPLKTEDTTALTCLQRSTLTKSKSLWEQPMLTDLWEYRKAMLVHCRPSTQQSELHLLRDHMNLGALWKDVATCSVTIKCPSEKSPWTSFWDWRWPSHLQPFKNISALQLDHGRKDIHNYVTVSEYKTSTTHC